MAGGLPSAEAPAVSLPAMFWPECDKPLGLGRSPNHTLLPVQAGAVGHINDWTEGLALVGGRVAQRSATYHPESLCGELRCADPPDESGRVSRPRWVVEKKFKFARGRTDPERYGNVIGTKGNRSRPRSHGSTPGSKHPAELCTGG